jgi:iron complex transport system ATP-binding protein
MAVTDAPGTNAPGSDDAAIAICDLSLRRGDVWILDGIDWTVPRGAVAAILGPNGSGKTTLTRVLTGYEWPTTGTVEVLGRRLGNTDVRELRRHVQVVNPSARYGVDAALSALDVVLTGYFATLSLYDPVTDEQRDRAAHLLRTVGLGHRIDQAYGLLSTGEQRRCLLARALVNIPQLLILDEPTAGLDVSAREHLLATIEQLHTLPGRPTVVTITHHVEEISPAASHVLLLKGGRVAARGRPDDVITPEVLSDLFDCKVYVARRSRRYWLEVLPEAWVDLLRGQ